MLVRNSRALETFLRIYEEVCPERKWEMIWVNYLQCSQSKFASVCLDLAPEKLAHNGDIVELNSEPMPIKAANNLPISMERAVICPPSCQTFPPDGLEDDIS